MLLSKFVGAGRSYNHNCSKLRTLTNPFNKSVNMTYINPAMSSSPLLIGDESKDKDSYLSVVAAVDVGTTSSRVIFFNKWGQDIAKHQIEYSTSASKEPYNASGDRRIPPTKKGKPSTDNLDASSSSDSSESVSTNSSRNDITGRSRRPNRNRDTIFSAEGYAIKANPNLSIEELEKHHHLQQTLRFPKPGWVECNPTNILVHVIHCLSATLYSLRDINEKRIKNHFLPYKVSCMGIANMRETTILWSKKTGEPVCEYGLVWNDTRNIQIVRDKKDNTPVEEQERIRSITGLPIYSTYFSCSKLRWFLDNVPACQKAYLEGDLMFGTVDTWLLYQLTKQRAFVSDVTNASRTGLMNLNTLDYDDSLLEYWDLDKNLINLPRIVSCSEYFGDFAVPDWIKSRLCEPTRLLVDEMELAKFPIQGCLGDQSASMVGQLAYKPGAAKCTYGTGCFLLYNTGTTKLISQNGALTTIGFWFPNIQEYGGKQPEMSKPHFALEGSIAVAGAVVQWLRDNLRLIAKSEDVGPIASTVPDSGGVVFVPAFSGLFAPYWDPDARATIMGMSQFTTASHIARAAVEGVCFQARAILRAMSSDAFSKDSKGKDVMQDLSDPTYEKSLLSVLAVDGGMSRSNEVMQIQADILGPCVRVRRSPTAECTALGAAIAANMAFKNPEDRPLWKDFHDVKKWVFYNGYEKEDNLSEENHPNFKVFESQSSKEERRKHWRLWEVAVARSKGWLKDVEDESGEVLEKDV